MYEEYKVIRNTLYILVFLQEIDFPAQRQDALSSFFIFDMISVKKF